MISLSWCFYATLLWKTTLKSSALGIPWSSYNICTGMAVNAAQSSYFYCKLFRMMQEMAITTKFPGLFHFNETSLWSTGAMHGSDRARGQGSTEERRCDKHNRWAIGRCKEKGHRGILPRLFLYIADLHRYGKIIEDKENAVLHKRDPFFKTMSDACRLLNGWPNNEGIL